ncbi:MAG TPA: polysaccharide biosynthesis C-terminal domain-containing protein [Actinomycetota bacterium]|nr:polysaccharide biosynthesis C-terminal domain-containing protein [Actinomycetota bacterium]
MTDGRTEDAGTATGAPPARARGGAWRRVLEGVLPAERFGDQRNILGNTGQNVLGLAIGALATFAAQVLMTNALGPARFGVVTVATQFAFIAAAATRFGMDVANVRLVAILVGKGEGGRVRGLVARSAGIAAGVSLAFAAAAFLASGALAERFTALPGEAIPAFRAAAAAVPLAALAFTYLGATRGLKIMRHTLYAQWIAQPIGWILLALAGWSVARTAGVTTLAYAGSWGLALVIAWWGWERETRGRTVVGAGTGVPEERTGALLRFGALRAPATLFSQLIFWADFYVLSRLSAGRGAAGAADVGVYGAALRAAQSLFLFLTSVSLTFSPFVADLHHRGERERLGALYRSVTRWTLGATVPVLLVLAILPEPVLRIFGGEFARGDDALRILIVGMIVPVMVGTVGFILIMVGRTGWDLLVYLAGLTIDVGVAFVMARPEVLGIRGAALAQALTLSFSALARLLLVRRFVGIWPFDRHFLRLLLPTAVGAAAMIGLDAWVPDARWALDLLVAGGGGSAVYAAALLLVGLTPGERRVAVALVRRALSPGGP